MWGEGFTKHAMQNEEDEEEQQCHFPFDHQCLVFSPGTMQILQKNHLLLKNTTKVSVYSLYTIFVDTI